MDDNYIPADDNQSPEIKAHLPAVKQTDDLEWKQFIHEELKKIENQENDLDIKSSKESEFTLSSLVEQLPVEELINTAIKRLRKKTKPKREIAPQRELVEKRNLPVKKVTTRKRKEPEKEIVEKRETRIKRRKREYRNSLYNRYYKK
ncbi:hypothetical protein JCM21714_3051 [Gracilibacillus boraciitolerans JCM 21714]|uniref:Uncharacterized protein n=1 Tax=Gracilibacillus boraciitolerans JCM 21714 TaxID=1298598 RepID=W4VKP2_9BACI|nr:hypothetical protein [Gracilibacillus boraciitolerans]GAE93930.1 hypothetical protein JCM21714_3051 [Gracilibacillus boraciitolerans JCM 21714]